MTNNEWLDNLPMEQKARFLVLYGLRRVRTVTQGIDEKPIDSIREAAKLHTMLLITEKEIMDWLKEEHK